MFSDFAAKLERYTFRTFRNYLAKKGYSLGHAVDKKKVQEFIQAIRPYATNKPLIRLGAEKDGGYLVPDDLENIEACFSPGVGAKSKFEEDCLQYGMKTFLADASVEEIPSENDHLKFIKKFVGSYNNEIFVTLDKWVNTAGLNPDSDLLLQMDIEGAEYEVLANVSPELLQRFRIMVFEIHFLDHLWNEDFYRSANACFQKLLQNHTCVHIHPNNTDVVARINGVEIVPTIEITFLRNDRIQEKERATKFPHPLDADNTLKPPVVLPQSWYQN